MSSYGTRSQMSPTVIGQAESVVERVSQLFLDHVRLHTLEWHDLLFIVYRNFLCDSQPVEKGQVTSDRQILQRPSLRLIIVGVEKGL